MLKYSLNSTTKHSCRQPVFISLRLCLSRPVFFLFCCVPVYQSWSAYFFFFLSLSVRLDLSLFVLVFFFSTYISCFSPSLFVINIILLFLHQLLFIYLFLLRSLSLSLSLFLTDHFLHFSKKKWLDGVVQLTLWPEIILLFYHILLLCAVTLQPPLSNLLWGGWLANLYDEK